MKTILFRLIYLIPFLALVACEQKSDTTIVVIETNDLHGEFSERMGKVAGYLQRVQEQHGEHLLLLDGGDFLQGTADVFFANYIDTLNEHPYAYYFERYGYDALAVGNHDFEAGHKIYDRVYSPITAPVLCANILEKSSGKPHFKPYQVFMKDGHKIAVLGLVSTTSINWLPENMNNGLKFQPLEQAAAKWVSTIRKREKPDLLIGLFHSGLGDTLPVLDPKGKDLTQNPDFGRDNSVAWVAANIPGIDLILCGHDHLERSDSLVNKAGKKVYILSGGPSAKSFSQATIHLSSTQEKETIIKIIPKLIHTDTLENYPAYREQLAQFFQRSSAYNQQEVCTIDTTIFSNDALNGPSSWLDLIHKDIYDYCNTPSLRHLRVTATLASAYLRDVAFEKGTLTVKDFINLYPYENKLSVIEMTLDELKRYMEYSYNLRIMYPHLPIYDFDTVYGINYTVDPAKPFGERVTLTKTLNGRVLSGGLRIHVALSSFRAMGGGGHFRRALLWDRETMKERRIWESDGGIRDLIIHTHKGDSTFHPLPSPYWSYTDGSLTTLNPSPPPRL